VVAHLRLGHRRGLIGGTDPPLNWRRQPNATDRARYITIRRQSASAAASITLRVPSTLAAVHGRVIGQPKMVAGRNVETPLAPFHSVPEPGAMAQVSLDALELDAREPGADRCPAARAL